MVGLKEKATDEEKYEIRRLESDHGGIERFNSLSHPVMPSRVRIGPWWD